MKQYDFGKIMDCKYNSVISSSSAPYAPSVKIIILSIHVNMFQ
ncbi:hypothetical protein B4168_2845 [Anoxybacillus flavithermus]|nr:hypothetical protein B4168_2845 [Anoxybacillus flavithermus]OAO84902.1 hypothetical protein GT23_3288 [Parageobacillus thermoglucosidasius]